MPVPYVHSQYLTHSLLFLALCLFACTVQGCECGIATYNLILQGNFTEKQHPYQHPGQTHFSSTIVSVHFSNFTLWKEHEVTSPGVQSVCETGSISILVGVSSHKLHVKNMYL